MSDHTCTDAEFLFPVCPKLSERFILPSAALGVGFFGVAVTAFVFNLNVGKRNLRQYHASGARTFSSSDEDRYPISIGHVFVSLQAHVTNIWSQRDVVRLFAAWCLPLEAVPCFCALIPSTFTDTYLLWSLALFTVLRFQQ